MDKLKTPPELEAFFTLFSALVVQIVTLPTSNAPLAKPIRRTTSTTTTTSERLIISVSYLYRYPQNDGRYINTGVGICQTFLTNFLQFYFGSKIR